MAAISRSNTSAKSSSEVFDGPADAAGAGMDGAAGTVDGFELVVALGAGFTGAVFQSHLIHLSRRGMRAARGSSPEFILQTLDFRTIEVINVRIVIH